MRYFFRRSRGRSVHCRLEHVCFLPVHNHIQQVGTVCFLRLWDTWRATPWPPAVCNVAVVRAISMSEPYAYQHNFFRHYGDNSLMFDCTLEKVNFTIVVRCYGGLLGPTLGLGCWRSQRFGGILSRLWQLMQKCIEIGLDIRRQWVGIVEETWNHFAQEVLCKFNGCKNNWGKFAFFFFFQYFIQVKK